MALPRIPTNPQTPIPNNPFYSPETSFVLGPYYNSSINSSSGLTIEPDGTIKVTGGGGGGGVSSVSGVSPVTVTSPTTTPVISVDAATTLAAGVVQLDDSTSSASSATAATSLAVKTAYDLANAALPTGGGIMTGDITFNPTQIFPVSGIQDASNADKGIVQIGTNIQVAGGVISVLDASTTQPGIVQLNDTTSSTSATQALTANQGKILQDQLNALVLSSNLTLAGTINAATGLMLTVTASGATAGFTVGNPMPAAAVGNTDYFTIVTTPGTMTPPGGSATACTQGDWWYSNGTAWARLAVGFTASAATTATPGIIQIATNALVQAGVNTTQAVVPSALQSKMSDSVSTTSSTTIASSTAVKAAYDLANTALPKAGGTMTGNITFGAGIGLNFPGGCNIRSISDSTSLVSSTTAASSTAVKLAFDTANTRVPLAGFTAKGVLLAGTAASTFASLPVGANGQVLTADSACTSGLKWAAAATPAIPCACITGKGALVSGTAANTPTALPVGTDGQVLVADSACAIGLKWEALPPNDAIPCATITAKGTLVTGTAANTPAGLPVGTNGEALLVDSACATGLKWGTPANNAIPCATITAKGTLVTGTAANTPVGLPVGTNGQTLVVDSTCTSGLKWASVAVPEATSVATGTMVGFSRTTSANVSLGFRSLCAATTGDGNTVLGYFAGCAITSGSQNTLVGQAAGGTLFAGAQNVGVGVLALNSALNGSCNVALGTCALRDLTNGTINVGVGLCSGINITTGCLNVAIGPFTNVVSPTGNCQLAIGFSATDNWLTGTSTKAIKPGAGIIDCAGSCGTVGQVLMSTGANAVCWSSTTVPNATPLIAGVVFGCTTTANNNTSFGHDSMAGATGLGNTAIGKCALKANTSGAVNTGVGAFALMANTTGGNNTALGACALQSNTTASGNTAVGRATLANNTAGSANTGVGSNVLFANTSGACNTAVGADALICNTTGSCNTAVGNCSLTRNTTGIDNLGIGPSALFCNTDGASNVAIGKNALYCNVSGACNTAVGPGALLSNCANGNVAVGFVALACSTLGVNNVAVGCSAMLRSSSGNNNVAVGNWALCCNLTACDNVAVGAYALQGTTGGSNVAVGKDALLANTSGQFNIGIGHSSLLNHATGGHNIGIGWLSGCGITSGSGNVGVGRQSLCSLTVGSLNVAIGLAAGGNITNGFCNVAIGPNVNVASATGDCQLAIGFNSTDNWLTGNCTKAIKPGAGIIDCANSCGTAGQVLMSNGANAVCWGTPAGGTDATVAVAGLVYGLTRPSCSVVSYGNTTIPASSTGTLNAVFGFVTGCSLTTGGANTLLGVAAGPALTTGCCNLAVGTYALYNATNTNSSTAVGSCALYNSAGIIGHNTALGALAGNNITSGGFNTIIGYNVNPSSATACCELAIGRSFTEVWLRGCPDLSIRPMRGIVDCAGATGTAGQALLSTGGNCVVWGNPTSQQASQIVSGGVLGISNTTQTVTALGCNAALAAGTGSQPGGLTAIGWQAGCQATTGATDNTFIGYNSGRSILSGDTNTAVGSCAMGSTNDATRFSSAVGWSALACAAGSFQTALGAGALRSAIGGSNIGIGAYAGCTITTGCNNIVIATCNAACGYTPIFNPSNHCNVIALGTTVHTSAYISTGWTVISDARDKTNITALPVGLDFVNKLNPVSYQRKENRDSDKAHGPVRYGFLAQEVLEAEGANPVIVNAEDPDQLMMTHDYLNAVFVKAIQELSAKNAELEARLAALEAK